MSTNTTANQRWELDLVVSPTFSIPVVNVGDVTALTDGQRSTVRELQSTAQRKKWSKDGKALPDGSFPIPNATYLKKAIKAFGRAASGKKAKVKRWIIRRARGLKRTDLLPESWGVGVRTVSSDASVAAAAVFSTAQHDGVMVAIYPPKEIAAKLAGTLDGDESVDDLHVTLAYLGTVDELTPEQLRGVRNAVEAVVADTAPFTAHVQGYGSFVSPESDNPRWYSVDADGLAELRTDLVQLLEVEGVEPRAEHDFTPHMTVRYGGDELSAIPPGGDDEWKVDALFVVVAGVRIGFQLGTKLGENDGLVKNVNFDLTDVELVNNLERWWKTGDGAKRIRWGTPGDWTRCHRQLRKHVGDERARRICAQWHKETTGLWPGDRRNNSISIIDLEEGRTMATINATGSVASADWSDDLEYFWNPDTDAVYRIDGEGVEIFDVGEVSETVEPGTDATPAAAHWRVDDVDSDVVRGLPAIDDPNTLDAIVGAADENTKASDTLPNGAGRRFKIPIVIPEGIPSGDRRTFAHGALEYKEPPIPLLWQRETDDGHKGSVTVGKITKIERLDGGLGNAEGVFDTHADAVEAARQVHQRFLTGVSGDVDQFKAELSESVDGEEDELFIQHGRLVAATLVAKPAFQEATIELVPEEGEELVITASGGPMYPPKEWFNDPKLEEPTRLIVTDDGRVYGHVGLWHTRHRGNPLWKLPKSPTNYRNFMTGTTKTENGDIIETGVITLTGGHADLSMSARQAAAHYDDTRSAVADVCAGKDRFGTWVAGGMRPGLSERQLRAFRGSHPSVDCRTVDGKLDLIAICQVNSPGFPVARTLVASGEQLALVAAGVAELYGGERQPREFDTLVVRVDALEARFAEQDRLNEQSRRAELVAMITA